ncbi:MAG TPA: hypothetical protein VLL52_17595 [Anaerolineae bacterium]|nr:hypothetical protein [Anaerolineae bacterium]
MKRVIWLWWVVLLLGCGGEGLREGDVASEPTGVVMAVTTTATVEPSAVFPTATASVPTVAATATDTKMPVVVSDGTLPAGIQYQLDGQLWQVGGEGVAEVVSGAAGAVQLTPLAALNWRVEKLTLGEGDKQTVSLRLYDQTTGAEVTLVEDVYDAELALAEVISPGWLLLGVAPTREEAGMSLTRTAVVRGDGSDYTLLLCESGFCPASRAAATGGLVMYSDGGVLRAYHLGQGYLTFDVAEWGVNDVEGWIWERPSFSPDGRYLIWSVVKGEGGARVWLIFDFDESRVKEVAVPAGLGVAYVGWPAEGGMAYVKIEDSVVPAVWLLQLADMSERYWYGVDEVSSAPDGSWLVVHQYESVEDEVGQYSLVSWGANSGEMIEVGREWGVTVMVVGWHEAGEYVVVGDGEVTWLVVAETGEEVAMPWVAEGVFWDPADEGRLLVEVGGEYFLTRAEGWEREEVVVPESGWVISWEK